MAQKKVSAALRLMNSENWSITTTLISASAVSVCCWAFRDPRSTTGLHRCVNRRCGSWPGSTLSTWRIPAAAAGGWSLAWPEKESRSAVTGCETSCGAWVCGRSTRNPEPPRRGRHQSDFPAWSISGGSQRWIRCGQLTSPTSRCRKAFSTWWGSWISIPGMCSAGSSPTALTRSSAWRPWRWPSAVAAGRRSSIPTRAANSPLETLWPGCRLRRSRSAGRAESAVTTTSLLKGCGGHSSTRRSTCVPTAMAGMPKSILLTSCGGTAM